MYPFVITEEQRKKHMEILAKQDINEFYNLVKPCVEIEKQIMSIDKSTLN